MTDKPLREQDAEAVSRPDLTEETLAYLEFQAADKLRVDANRTAMGMVPTDAWRKDAAMYAHAAECVRKRAELEAEVARLRDELAVTAKILAERERECIALRPAYKATSYGPGLTIPTPRTDG